MTLGLSSMEDIEMPHGFEIAQRKYYDQVRPGFRFLPNGGLSSPSHRNSVQICSVQGASRSLEAKCTFTLF